MQHTTQVCVTKTEEAHYRLCRTQIENSYIRSKDGSFDKYDQRNVT